MGLFDLFRRKPASAADILLLSANAEADEHADLAELIFKPLYLK